MIKESDNLNNLPLKEDSSTFLKHNSNILFSNTPEKVIRNNHILDLIRRHHPINPYQLAKMVKWSYSEVCRVIRDLEYCGLIRVKVVLGHNNRANKIISLPTEEELKNG